MVVNIFQCKMKFVLKYICFTRYRQQNVRNGYSMGHIMGLKEYRVHVSV